MITEQSIEKLDRHEEFQKLYFHQNKFILEEFNQPMYQMDRKLKYKGYMRIQVAQAIKS